MSGEARIAYRKLPGRRRGFIRGSSVWLGPDHLLLVKSVRFREEYRRFYFRDVQAIAVAKAPRFHVSTRVVPLLLLAMFAVPALYGFTRGAASRFPILSSVFWPSFWSTAALLLGVWVVISSQFSCRCRIYTAVSGEELPGIYRAWTARRFLAKVEPLILQAQGAIEGNWAEAVEGRAVGPVEPAPPLAEGETPLPGAQPQGGASTAALCLAAALVASGAFDLLTLHSRTAWTGVMPLWFAVAKIAAATAVFIQYNRGKLRRGVQRIAIAALVALGVMFYINQFRTSMTTASARGRAVTFSTVVLGGTPVLRGAEGGADLLLGFAAAVLLLTGSGKA